ncbi:MAG TPA: sigma-70 family RNA polymerase sigma factor [Solirubrobacteraceae bacterium]|nr:sigma-70 family RNA polymerase sigma factor [Solirubrobacteraceae bacterium]
MNDIAWETEQFVRHRSHLEAVAYRMLGSVSEAEDALQEAWLRLSRSQQDTIHNARAWLTTIVGRVCIDMLRARQSRREDYVAWVPEPIVQADEQGDPEQQALIADTVGLALLVVLETLTPSERVAYVLHDMFAVPFGEIGGIIDRSPDAARQLASRARRRVHGAVPQPDADLAKQREVVDAFLAASRAGDFDALLAVLDPEVVFRAGGSPELQQELKGAAGVADRMATFGPRFATLCHPAMVNGRAGLVIRTPAGPLGAIGFTVTGDLITTIGLTLDPDKLEGSDQTEDGPLDLLRMRPGSGAERIIRDVLGWPGAYRTKGEFGSVVLRFGERELGHLHGDAMADVPLAPGLPDHLVKGGVALERESGWVTVPLETEAGVQQALALLRANYERG